MKHLFCNVDQQPVVVRLVSDFANRCHCKLESPFNGLRIRTMSASYADDLKHGADPYIVDVALTET